MALKRGDAKWPDRDRFTYGKGHAAVRHYPILTDLGFLPKEVLEGYCQLGNPLGDHPDMTKVPVDFSSGSIGHALSNGLSMALGGRLPGRDFTVVTMMGDGEQQEGQVWQAWTRGSPRALIGMHAALYLEQGHGAQPRVHRPFQRETP